MNSMHKLINCYRQIRESAGYHDGNPNILMDTLCSDIKHYTTSTFAKLIIKVTLNTSLNITKAEANNHNIDGDTVHSVVHHHRINIVANHDKAYAIVRHHKNRWIIKANMPLHASDSINLTNYHYSHGITYKDVIAIVQRCYDITNKIYNWYTTNEANTTQVMILKVSKLIRFIQHGFVNEALNELFSGAYLDTVHHQIHFTNQLSYLADQAVAKHPYKTINSNQQVVCCNINDMLCGNDNIIHQLHLKPHDIRKIKFNEAKLRHIRQQGTQYLLVITDKKNPFACALKKVDQRNGIEIMQVVKQAILQHSSVDKQGSDK